MMESKGPLGDPTMPRRLAADTIAAACASAIVSPLITIIDRSIVENASGAKTLVFSLRSGAVNMVVQPFDFLRSRAFGLVWGLYFLTYLTANVVETVCSAYQTDSAIPKMLTVAPLNVALC